MRKTMLLTVVAMLVSRVAVADVVRHGSIPESYTGTWIAGTETESDKSVIVISAKMYVSPEAICSVDWVSQTAGARGSIYSAHLQCSYAAEGQGKGNKTTENLIIWPESINWIAVGPEFTSLKIFHRRSATYEAQRNGLHSNNVGAEECPPHSESNAGSTSGDAH
jgi:hypothetical protein